MKDSGTRICRVKQRGDLIGAPRLFSDSGFRSQGDFVPIRSPRLAYFWLLSFAPSLLLLLPSSHPPYLRPTRLLPTSCFSRDFSPNTTSGHCRHFYHYTLSGRSRAHHIWRYLSCYGWALSTQYSVVGIYASQFSLSIFTHSHTHLKICNDGYCGYPSPSSVPLLRTEEVNECRGTLSTFMVLLSRLISASLIVAQCIVHEHVSW